MTGLSLREMVVVEVKISNQWAIVKAGRRGRGPSPADYCAPFAATKLCNVLSQFRGDGATQSGDCTPERVQNGHLQVKHCTGGKTGIGDTGDERCQFLCIRHRAASANRGTSVRLICQPRPKGGLSVNPTGRPANRTAS